MLLSLYFIHSTLKAIVLLSKQLFFYECQKKKKYNIKRHVSEMSVCLNYNPSKTCIIIIFRLFR